MNQGNRQSKSLCQVPPKPNDNYKINMSVTTYQLQFDKYAYLKAYLCLITYLSYME